MQIHFECKRNIENLWSLKVYVLSDAFHLCFITEYVALMETRTQVQCFLSLTDSSSV